jgi:hypothetical protein
MRSFIASLRSLVLPFGATTGQRIVLDSDNGVISVYDSANSLLAQIGPTFTPEVGFTSYSYTFPYTIKGMLSGGSVVFEHVGSNQWSNGVIESSAGGSPLDYLDLTVSPGSPDSGTDRPRITLTSQKTTDPLIDLSSDGSRPLNLSVDGVAQGRGLTAQATATSSSATTTTTEIAVMTLSAVTFKAGRAYRINFNALARASAVTSQISAHVRTVSVAGRNLIDSQGGDYLSAAATNYPWRVTGLVANTGADLTTDVLVTMVRTAGAGTVQMIADAQNPATAWIEDIGLAADFPNLRTVI